MVGISSLEIEDAGIHSFRKLLAEIVERYPHTKNHLLNSDNALRPDVPVYVDGRNPRLLKDGLDTPLRPDSVISFFSPVSSGRMNVEVLRESQE